MIIEAVGGELSAEEKQNTEDHTPEQHHGYDEDYYQHDISGLLGD